METWYKLDIKSKNLVDELITKVETDGCFNTTKLTELKEEMNWFNFPYKINQVIQVLDDNRYPHNVEKALWYKLPYTIVDLQIIVDNFSCLNIPDIEVPSVPQNLVSSSITATSVVLDWDVSTDNIGVVSYNIYKDSSVTASRVGNTATISGLTASTTYIFEVTALDEAGNESALSTSVSVTTTA